MTRVAFENAMVIIFNVTFFFVMVTFFRSYPKGKLIHLNQYEQTLKGVLVIIRFTLKSWPFNAYDTTNADIINIRVLIPHQSTSTSEKKMPKNRPFESGSTQPHSKKTHAIRN